MLRRVVLSLVLVVSLLVMLPFATSLAHSLRFQSSTFHRLHHSRAWWRQHRARMLRRQAMLARRRQALMARKSGEFLGEPKASDNHVTLPNAISLPDGLSLDRSFRLPSGWSSASSRKGAATFRVASENGSPAGQVTLAVIAAASPSAAQPTGREQKHMLGTVSFSDLRRTVIDRMLSAGGWVVNDREREIGGHRVFQVIAQTPGDGAAAAQIWDFYFTEIDGKLYSLTTHSAGEFSEKLTTDAEKFLTAFRPMINPYGANR